MINVYPATIEAFIKILLEQENIRRDVKRVYIFLHRRNIRWTAKNVFLLKDKTIRFIFFDNRSSYKTHFIYSSQRARYDFKI